MKTYVATLENVEEIKYAEQRVPSVSVGRVPCMCFKCRLDVS